MTKQLQKFLRRIWFFSFFASIVFLLLTIGYIVFDPFKVLYAYNDYSDSAVIPNRDFVSTEMFINNHQEFGYNSFIFGSSRTLGFHISSWEKYLSNTDIPFMFDASKESIYGIYSKLRYLSNSGIDINNVIILICRDSTFDYVENNKGHILIKHPDISNESLLQFHYVFLKAYFSFDFIISYFTYKITGNIFPFMGGVIEERNIVFDQINNQITIKDQELELFEDSEGYYERRRNIFYERETEKTYPDIQILHEHKRLLISIKNILVENETDYKVVISPLYEQVKFNEKDYYFLRNLFEGNLYDFSGKNCFTDNYKNYYENSHFRPHVGDSILSIIYR